MSLADELLADLEEDEVDAGIDPNENVEESYNDTNDVHSFSCAEPMQQGMK